MGKRTGKKNAVADLPANDLSEGVARSASSPEEAVRHVYEAMIAGDIGTAFSFFPKRHANAFRKISW